MASVKRSRLLLLCGLVWAGLWVAGLWPFNFFPWNRADWLGAANGIRFSPHGQIYASSSWNLTPVPLPEPPGDAVSIELWLQSDRVCGCVGTILSLYNPAQRGNFRIEQSVGDLVVRGRFRDQTGHSAYRSLWLDEVLAKGRSRFVTIVSGPQGTTLYLEGAPSRRYPYAPLGENLSGRLLLGHSPKGNPWAGALFGLAIYKRALTADEVLRNYRAWTESQAAGLDAQSDLEGLYLFDERNGDLVHNRSGQMPNLAIPQRFFVLRHIFLERAIGSRSAFLKDVILNIVGFIPFGLLISLYFFKVSRWPKTRAAVVAVILGGMTSLAIELLQAYLPSRDSSLPDLINNFLGTALGALALGWLPGYLGREGSET